MPILNRRQLYTYALVSQGVHGSQDILSGLLPFLQPLIADRHGRIFHPQHFAEALAQTYGWPVSTDVIEELIPRLEAQGWLQPVSNRANKAAYLCKADFASVSPNDDAAATILNQIEGSFHEFAQHLSPLIKFHQSSEELLEIFLNWLISIEKFDRASLLSTTRQLVSKEFKLTLEPSKSIFNAVSAVDSDSAFLAARFVQHLAHNDPGLLHHLVEIASLALLTEVILDFRDPPNAARQEPGLMVFLDGPFVMDLLALSGHTREQNAKQILDGLRRMSCQLRVFSHNCDEIRANLQAVLGQLKGQRFGPTAEAIRRSELEEDYARAVANNVEHFVNKELQINVLNWNMELFPGEHLHFPKEAYEDFVATLHFHERIPPRERDAKSVAIVMRRRSGKQSRDVFSTRFFLITRNYVLAQYAREFCVRRGLLREHEEGPVVTQRRLAALLWLTLGAQERQELTRRQLLVACERVTQLRPELIEGAMKKLRRVREADLSKLEALLTQPRSAQLLLNLTMNREEVVTDDNIEDILEMMVRTAGDQIREQSREEIEKIKRKARTDLGREREQSERVAASLAAKEGELKNAQVLLERKEKADVDMMQRWVEDAVTFQRSAIRTERYVLVVLAVVLTVVGWVLDTDAMPTFAAPMAWVAALLSLFFLIGSIVPGFRMCFERG